jgi:hypothetical protein
MNFQSLEKIMGPGRSFVRGNKESFPWNNCMEDSKQPWVHFAPLSIYLVLWTLEVIPAPT